MKKMLLYFIPFCMFSCIMIDDDADIPTFEDIPIAKEFLINEKWKLTSVFTDPDIDFNGDGEETGHFYGATGVTDGKIITDQVDECNKDNFYVFNTDLTDDITIDYGSILCGNEENKEFEYELDVESKKMKIPSFLEKFYNEDGYLYLYNISFSQHIEDDSQKNIRGEYLYEYQGKQYMCTLYFYDLN